MHMNSLKEYIIKESLKDKIKEFISKFNKDKSAIKSSKCVDDYKDQTVTEKDIDEIINIKEKEDTAGYLFDGMEMTLYGKYKPKKNKEADERYIFHKLSYKQGMLDYAYNNFNNTLNQDPFGESSCDHLYYRVMKVKDDRGIGLIILGRYFYGWHLAQDLNLKCEKKIELEIK